MYEKSPAMYLLYSVIIPANRQRPTLQWQFAASTVRLYGTDAHRKGVHTS